MKSSEISYHITGYFPCRLADPDDREGIPWVVSIRLGFDPMCIAVWGDGLNESDAVEAAFEHLRKINPDWAETEEDWQRHEEAAFAKRVKVEP